jgi:cytochrome d ubiquinol oxidase subunit II
MSYPTLCEIWFVLLGVLLGGYAVLDGFDLGVGILYPFVAKDDTERRIALNTIGPIWDGNEVWLVTFGGAMFAMFPLAYESIFSGFYSAFMLLLFMLISRAVSMEFRSKMQHALWRNFWDGCFFVGSAGATLLFGVAVGNALRGVYVDPAGDIPGGMLTQLHPFCLLVGLLAVAMFAMHGAIYLHLKTQGPLQQRIEATIWRCFAAFVALFVVVSAYTLTAIPQATQNFARHPWLWIVPVLNVLAIANIPRAMRLRRALYAFVSSACTILAFVFLLGTALFPNMVASVPIENSMTIYHAASSPKTLTIGLIIVAFGMPCVLAYTSIIYWTFRGKVELGAHSY